METKTRGQSAVYREERDRLLAMRRQLSVHFREEDRLRLRACDREIKRARSRLDRENVEALLKEAQVASD
eukprot:5443663-Pyramimonas_sp.AAC.1